MAPSFNGLGFDSTSASSDGDLAAIRRRFEQLNRLDEERSKFTAELIARHELVVQQNQAMLAERSRELEWVLQWQSDKEHYENCMRNMQRELAAWRSYKSFNALSPPFVPAGIGYDVKDNANSFAVSTGLPPRFPAPSSPPPPPLSPSSILDSPLPSNAALNQLAKTPSTSSIASDSLVIRRPISEPISYAAKAAAPPPSAPPSPIQKPPQREEVIARNRAGQRVDPPCKSYDKTEVDRIKKLKLCNVHFLRKECPYGEQCTHSHAFNPTDSEIATLRLVARMAPCVYGSGCQDIKCIYGHRCAAPPHKTNHVKGIKSCIFGEACKFPEELHDVDTHVVKTLVIR